MSIKTSGVAILSYFSVMPFFLFLYEGKTTSLRVKITKRFANVLLRSILLD